MRKILFCLSLLALVAGCKKPSTPVAISEIVLSADDASHGTAVATVNGTEVTEAPQGAEIEITAMPEPGCEFKKWEVVAGRVALSNDEDATTTFTMPASAVYITAVFAAPYAVSFSIDPAGGGTAVATVDGVATTEPLDGATVEITATPANGYVFKQWTVTSGGATLSSTTANPATFTMPKSAVEIKAEFTGLYQVGDRYPHTGTAQGVVFWIDPAGVPQGGTGSAGGKIVAPDETSAAWCTEFGVAYGIDDESDGAVNLATVRALANWATGFPAFKWCADKGEGWYLPAFNELGVLRAAWQVDPTAFDAALVNAGGTAITEDYVWSSTEMPGYAHNAKALKFLRDGSDQQLYMSTKPNLRMVRAIRTF